MEKRKYIRFSVIMDAIWRSGKSKQKMQVSDVSKEGIGLVSREGFKEGQNIEMEMMIPGDNIPVIFEGEVAWTKTPGYDTSHYRSGVKFTKISNEDKSRMQEFIYNRWIMPASAKVK